METEFDGDHLSSGINFIGMFCPGGPDVGDPKSRDLMGLGPNALKPVSRDCNSRDSALSPYYNHVKYEIKL